MVTLRVGHGGSKNCVSSSPWFVGRKVTQVTLFVTPVRWWLPIVADGWFYYVTMFFRCLLLPKVQMFTQIRRKLQDILVIYLTCNQISTAESLAEVRELLRPTALSQVQKTQQGRGMWPEIQTQYGRLLVWECSGASCQLPITSVTLPPRLVWLSNFQLLCRCRNFIHAFSYVYLQ